MMTYEFDLGSYSRPVTTSSPEAQLWFDRGLLWTYGFNHEEAVLCFKQAAKADPKCAMAYWGIAYAMGPNYNKPWEAFDEAETSKTLSESYDATTRAAALADSCTQAERDLIGALHQRYQSARVPQNLAAWVDDFADAMRAVYLNHGEDADISALFAEALMNRTPWALWDLASGKPAAGADTEEVRQALERGMERRAETGAPPHPGMLHMYIHLMEMSPFPERALLACDQLRGLVPDSGHLQHMATHIDVLCGDYLSVVNWNEEAIRADRRYLAARGPFNFYTLYRCHDYHFKAYGAMFLGQYQSAIEGGRGVDLRPPRGSVERAVAAHGRLAGRAGAGQTACIGAVRQMAGNPCAGTAGESRTVLRDQRNHAVCQGHRPRNTGGFEVGGGRGGGVRAGLRPCAGQPVFV